MLAMAEQGVTHFYETGSGKVLAGLVKRTAPSANAISVGAAKEVDDAVQALGK
jgi:[acyl-carrier-protein] S-malonyltransferase